MSSQQLAEQIVAFPNSLAGLMISGMKDYRGICGLLSEYNRHRYLLANKYQVSSPTIVIFLDKFS